MKSLLILKPALPINYKQYSQTYIPAFIEKTDQHLLFSFDLSGLPHLSNHHKSSINDLSSESRLLPDFMMTDDPFKRKDFLWEATCLELFIGLPNQTSYLEFNISLDDEWNIYVFEDYRHPDLMPPNRATVPSRLLKRHMLGVKEGVWQYGMSLSALEKCFQLNSKTIDNMDGLMVNLCSVVKVNDQCLYFASAHAEPADFHNQKFWVQI